MVNTGRPSRGCLTCRRRRVKCDETRPNCRRCIKLNVECAWKDDWNSRIRPQETWAKERVARRVERVQHLRDARAETQQEIGPKDPLLNEVSVAIPLQPQIGAEYYAINRLYRDYAYSAATCPFIFAWLDEQKDTPGCLQSVIPAVALASVAKQQKRYDLMAEASRYYGRTLTGLAQALGHADSSKHDATLLTAYLLGIYEFISHDGRQSAPSPFKSHGPGRLALLRIRGRAQLRTQLGRHLLLLVYHDHLAASLHGDIEPLEECASWIYEVWEPSPTIAGLLFMHDVSSFLWRCKKSLSKGSSVPRKKLLAMLRTGLSLNDLALDLLRLYHTGDVHGNKAAEHYGSRHPNVQSPEDLNVATFLPSQLSDMGAEAIRTNFDKPTENSQHPMYLKVSPITLAREMETSIETTRQTPESNPEVSQYPTCVKDMQPDLLRNFREQEGPHDIEAYINVTRAGLSAIGRAIHIQLLTGLLQLSAALRRSDASVKVSHQTAADDLDPEVLEAGWNETIRHHATDILDDIPLAVGEAGPCLLDKGSAHRAYIMLFPLRTALGAEQATKQTREGIRSILRHIDDTYGIGLAKELSKAVDDARLPYRTGETKVHDP